MRDPDRIEEMLRLGKPVKIEPILRPVETPPLPGSNVKSEMISEERRKIADRLVELSDGVLSLEDSDRHIALRIGSPPNCNAVTVSKRADRVTFLIRSIDLLRKAEQHGFKPVSAKLVAQRDKDRHRFQGLSASDIQAHESIFKEIVMDSVRTIMDRRPKKN